MFKSKKEFAEAMMEGKRFSSLKGRIMYWDGSAKYNSPFRASGLNTPEKTVDMVGLWKYYGEVTELKEWFVRIPEQGVLCWVSDEKPSPGKDRVARIITHYNKGYSLPFKGVECWTYATPLTKEEALAMIAE